MKHKECVIITPNSKELPIPGLENEYIKGKNLIITDDINMIGVVLTKVSKDMPSVKAVIVEDLNHFFNARVTSTEFRSRNSGNDAFAKWNDFGADVTSSLITIMTSLRDDLTVVAFAHTDTKESGKIGMKTSGKLLDNSIDVPSYVTYLLHSMTIDEEGKIKYKFLTNTDGIRLAKTPAGMFKEKYIPNDLNLVLKQIEAYNKGDIKVEWID